MTHSFLLKRRQFIASFYLITAFHNAASQFIVEDTGKKMEPLFMEWRGRAVGPPAIPRSCSAPADVMVPWAEGLWVVAWQSVKPAF